MRNVIWKKLLLFIAAPFLLCFGLLLFSILHSIYVDMVAQVQVALSYQAQFNQSRLLGKVDSASMSIMTAVNFLRALDPRHPDARKSGESALLVMLENPDIHNAWLVYEPNAFDGRDAADKEGYPGAPSGRFMRSFGRGKNGPVVVGDMHEDVVDDLLRSPWYATAKQTGQPYISVNEDTDNDFRRNGGDKSDVISIAVPIFQNGVFVGCVGGDIPTEQMISRGEERLPIVSVLFSPDYQVRFAPNKNDIGKSLDEMGIANVQAVKQAFREAKPLFLSGEQFYFTGEKSFLYFVPIYFKDFNTTSYLALGVPISVIDHALLSLVMTVALALIVLLLVFLGLLFYVGRLISRPIQALARVAGNASLDDARQFKLETSKQASEIGQITTAFLNMAASLQARIQDEHWPQEMLELHLMLEEGVYRGESFERLFRHTASRFASCFGARRIALERVVGSGGDALEIASYSPTNGLAQEKQPALWAPLWKNAAGKPLVWHDEHEGHERATEHANERANTEQDAREAVCALPIRVDGALWGALVLILSGPLPETRTQHLEFIAAGINYLLAAKKEAA
jgi:HAMP domain-containing protein